MTTLLVDADLVSYRCAASVKKGDPLDIAIARCDRLMTELLALTVADDYKGFLTGGENFRRKINPQYKANRDGMERPEWLEQCREFLIDEWKCVMAVDVEADDMLGIHQDKEKNTTIIASLDKDLKMIPGRHYSWEIGGTTVKGAQWTRPEEYSIVSVLDGLKHFYRQMLVGDTSDNIYGAVGVGKVKAAKYIDPLETEEEMIETVFDLYDEDAERFIMNAQCLWIMQNEGETWIKRINHLTLPNLLKQDVAAKSEYMMSLTQDI